MMTSHTERSSPGRRTRTGTCSWPPGQTGRSLHRGDCPGGEDSLPCRERRGGGSRGGDRDTGQEDRRPPHTSPPPPGGDRQRTSPHKLLRLEDDQSYQGALPTLQCPVVAHIVLVTAAGEDVRTVLL